MEFILIDVLLFAVSCFILSLMINAAVQDGMIQATNLNRTPITNTICLFCGNEHKLDDPTSPHCGHKKQTKPSIAPPAAGTNIL